MHVFATNAPLLSSMTKPAAAAPMCRVRTSPWRIAKFVGEAQLRWTLDDDKAKVGKWIKNEMCNLGPAFIKLGQFLSTRPDILGADAVSELSKLQDDIVPEPFEAIQYVIEEAIGKAVDEVFQSVEPDCIASASIGQVHRAVLRDGTPVVIKIQKPCVARQIKDDIDTLHRMNAIIARTGNPRSVEVDNILRQYEHFLSAELDFMVEMKHMEAFYDMMDGMPVIVPRVYKEYSSNSILVMEYVESTKITDVEKLKSMGFDATRIAESLVDIFLFQIVHLGYVHCDPHPGNIGVAQDGETIVLYDFGNVIQLSKDFRKQINTLVFDVFQKDAEDFVNTLLQLNILEVRSDTEKLEVKEFFRAFFAYLDTLNFENMQASLLQQEMQGGVGAKIHVNPDFLGLFRVFSLLDGTCVRLDPNFSYTDALRPYVDDIIKDTSFVVAKMMKDIEKVRTFPSLLKNTEDSVTRLHKRVSTLDTTVRRYQVLSVLLLASTHTNDLLTVVLTSLGAMAVWAMLDRK